MHTRTTHNYRSLEYEDGRLLLQNGVFFHCGEMLTNGIDGILRKNIIFQFPGKVAVLSAEVEVSITRHVEEN